MEWYQVFIGVGGGSILTIILTHYLELKKVKILHALERGRWLNDNRLRAFSSLVQHLLSLGEATQANIAYQTGSREKYLRTRALASEAILLVDDDSLSLKIVENIDTLQKTLDAPQGGRKREITKRVRD